MRHFYKSHGKHCFLRSFQTSCPSCGADVLYWECHHGSKIFFQYPPYGKLIKHYCRSSQTKSKVKTIHPIIVKIPKRIFEVSIINCPICGKIFKNESNLHDHIEQMKKNDLQHKLFVQNKLSFDEDLNNKVQVEFPKFGKINIKKRKNNS